MQIIKYQKPSNFLFLEKTFEGLSDEDDKCEVYGGAIRDQLLGIKEVDVDIKITQKLYRSFVIEMRKQFRLISKSWICNKYDYCHSKLIIDTPFQKGLILDISFFDDKREIKHSEMVDFTVNNLKQSLIGPNKGKLMVRSFPLGCNVMSYTEWLAKCIKDIYEHRLVCIYDTVSPYNIHEFINWNLETFEYRQKRLEKMKGKNNFKDSKVEYLTKYRFDKNIVYGSYDKVEAIEEDKCPICLVDWKDITTKTVTFKCRHMFCIKCISNYMNASNLLLICPTCKQAV